MGEAEVLLVRLADPQDDALGVREHHVVRQDQIVLRIQDLKEALQIDVLVKNIRKIF